MLLLDMSECGCGELEADLEMKVLPEVPLHKVQVPREAAIGGRVNTCECNQLQEQQDCTWRNSSESFVRSMH